MTAAIDIAPAGQPTARDWAAQVQTRLPHCIAQQKHSSRRHSIIAFSLAIGQLVGGGAADGRHQAVQQPVSIRLVHGPASQAPYSSHLMQQRARLRMLDNHSSCSTWPER